MLLNVMVALFFCYCSNRFFQVSMVRKPGSGCMPLSDAGVYSDVTTTPFKQSNVSGLDGYQYLCVVKLVKLMRLRLLLL